ncbi:MAG TPA: M20 family metallopeptidase [Paenalcaligenes sp.]|nr:M20 family metallopeptidase [Paenalcaligenes sp.]
MHDQQDITQQLLEQIQTWIEIESPSHDADALQRMAKHIHQDAQDAGLNVEVLPLHADTGPALHIHNRAAGDTGKGILVLGHYDTVHPIGTLERNPCRQEGDKLYGPGGYDMKAGICLALYGLSQAIKQGGTALPVDLLLLPDEETGSHYSRPTIEQFAANARYALVAEPARANGGRCVTARKGTGTIQITAHGQASHAGIAHEQGQNAIEEMAHQITALQKMTDYEQGITVSVGTIQGGTTSNVVPDHCFIEADFRVVDEHGAQHLQAQVEALRNVNPQVKLDIKFDLNRPSMPRTAATEALLEQCQKYAQLAHWSLQEAPRTGGASDANFTAALGVPTLDGLGADGDGAHTLHEHILVSTLAQRAKFWLYTLMRLR